MLVLVEYYFCAKLYNLKQNSANERLLLRSIYFNCSAH